MSLWTDNGGSGPELVLLHGWGMNAAVWSPLLDALRARYRVTRLELPGHGASAPLEADLAAWARACLDAAPPGAAWLGWSLGGLVAQQAALLDPARIGRLCLVASTPCFVQRADWDCAMPAAVFRQFAQALSEDIDATLRRFLGLQVKGAPDARHLLRLLDQALAARPAADPAGLRAGLQLLLDGDLRSALGRLAMPVHWLLGARDTLVPPALAQTLPEWLEAADVTLLRGAGHAPFLSHGADFLDWLALRCG